MGNFKKSILAATFLLILMPNLVFAQVSSTTVPTTTLANSTSSTATLPSSSLKNLVNEAVGPAVNKAHELTNKVTTTAEMVGGIYNDGKGMFGEILKIVQRGREVVGNLERYFQKLTVYWDKISNHNDKVRVGIIVGVVIIAILFLRRI